MDMITIPHDALVFVGDGRKALFLRNAGDEKFPNLITERVFAEGNPAAREHGTDRPGRASSAPAPTVGLAWRRPTGMSSASIVSLAVLPLPWRKLCGRAA